MSEEQREDNSPDEVTDEKSFYKVQTSPYAKIDPKQEVAISKEKQEELKKEAETEAKKDERVVEDPDKYDEVFKEKYDQKTEALKEKLTALKDEILHYNKQLSTYEDIPFKYRGQHAFYHAAKYEHDKAAYEYEKIGGAVGTGQFLSEKMSTLKMYCSLSDLCNCDYAFSEIQEFFGENALLVGYNVDFDIDMLRGMYKRQKTELKFWYKLDVLEMARDILYGKEIEDYSLSTLIRHLGLDSGITFHQADDDVLATWRLMEYCYNEYKELRKTQPSSLEHVYINSIYFWKGYNKFQQGVYLNTSLGKMYYSTFQKAWFSSNINLERVDIDAIEREVLIRMGIDSNKELGKMTARKFENIKKGKQFV